MNLFLVSSAESKLNDEMYLNPIKVETTENILYNMFSLDYVPEVIIVTKAYVDLVGVSVVTKALQTLHHVHPFSLIYIMSTDNFDIFVKNMESFGIMPVKGDVSTLTPMTISKILDAKIKLDIAEVDQSILGQYKGYISDYLQIIDDEAKKMFITNNMDEIMTALNTLVDMAYENESLRKLYNELSSHLVTTLNMTDSYQKKLVDKSIASDNLRARVEELQEILIRNSDRISNYNTMYDTTMVADLKNNTVVLYFKELEDIDFFRFYESLQEYLETRGLYVKSLIVEEKEYIDYSRFGYHRCLDEVSLSNLADWDKIVRFGTVKKLVEILASEQFKVQVLMIFDRTRFYETFVTSQNVLTFYVGKYRKRYANILIPDSSFISPYEGDWTNIEKLLVPVDNNEIPQLAYISYSNRHPLTVSLYELIKDTLESMPYR